MTFLLDKVHGLSSQRYEPNRRLHNQFVPPSYYNSHDQIHSRFSHFHATSISYQTLFIPSSSPPHHRDRKPVISHSPTTETKRPLLHNWNVFRKSPKRMCNLDFGNVSYPKMRRLGLATATTRFSETTTAAEISSRRPEDVPPLNAIESCKDEDQSDNKSNRNYTNLLIPLQQNDKGEDTKGEPMMMGAGSA